jgi:hypothetical protein
MNSTIPFRGGIPLDGEEGVFISLMVVLRHYERNRYKG